MARRWIAALVVTALLGSITIATGRGEPLVDTTAVQPERWTTANLSEAREAPAVARVGTKVLFAGGCAGTCRVPRRITRDGRIDPWDPSAAVDIYDSATGQWSSARLSEARLASAMAVATVGSQVLFAGGVYGTMNYAYRHSDQVDIYDDATGEWSTARLSARWESLTATEVGPKVLFVGGRNDPSQAMRNVGDPDHVPSAVVDIYDSTTRQWSTTTLSVAHSGAVEVAKIGDLVLVTGDGRGVYSPETDTEADVVGIFDSTSGMWAAARLSQPRYGKKVVTVGTQVLFIGGITGPGVDPPPSSAVDIYDSATGQWSSSQLPHAVRHPLAAVVGSQMLIVGPTGSNGTEIHIYDSTTQRWSTVPLSEPRSGLRLARVGTQVLMAGGEYRGALSATVDIYDSATGRWSAAALSLPRILTHAAPVGRQVLFAGASTRSEDRDRGNVVDIYCSATGGWSSLPGPSDRDNMRAATVGTRVLFAGGSNRSGPSARVDIYHATGCD